MKQILTTVAGLSISAAIFVASPLFADKSQPAKIKAAAIQVEIIQSDEIKLPAEFQISLYENLIRRLEKQGGFQHVYRDGVQRHLALWKTYRGIAITVPTIMIN
jgi:hypothetical protein